MRAGEAARENIIGETKHKTEKNKIQGMKKLLLTLALIGTVCTVRADEGMWLLPYLQKMNIKDMRAEGCRLTAEDI